MLEIRQLKIKGEDSKQKITKVVGLGAVVLVVFFFLEIWVVNRLSTYGYKIAELKSLQSELELENQVMENQISESSSLTIIEKKASKVGLGPVKSVDYYKLPNIASALTQ